MIKKFRTFILALVTGLMLAAPVVGLSGSVAALGPTVTAADSVSDACAGIGLTGSGCSDSSDISKVVKTIINILSAIVGVAAVIMIIISGFRYITSGGDSNKVAAAKTSLIYAIVGLIVVALAQLIVHVVIKSAAPK